VPYWKSELDTTISLIQSNILSKGDRDQIRERVDCDADNDPFFDLFMNGLLGVAVSPYMDSKAEFWFRQFDPDRPVDEQSYKQAKWFSVHPCVNIAVYANKEVYKPNPWNVSGHGRIFVEPKEKGHVHIGAGALGLGCVAPLIGRYTGIGLCILHRTDKNVWGELKNSGADFVEIEQRILNKDFGNYEADTPLRLRFLTDQTPADTMQKELEGWVSGGSDLFVVTSRQDGCTTRSILSKADTISTSVRAENLADVGNLISDYAQPGAIVMPFENDEKAIEVLRGHLAVKNMVVMDICPDRICLKPSIENRGETVSIRVGVERYQRTHMHDGTGRAFGFLFPDRECRNLVKDGAIYYYGKRQDYEFARYRKRILVNGMHFFLGLAARKCLQEEVGPSWGALTDVPAMQLLLRMEVVQTVAELCDRVFGPLVILEALKRKWVAAKEDDIRAARRVVDEEKAEAMDRIRTMPDSVDRIIKPEPEAFAKKGKVFLKSLRSLPESVRLCNEMRCVYDDSDIENLKNDIESLSRLFLDQLFELE